MELKMLLLLQKVCTASMCQQCHEKNCGSPQASRDQDQDQQPANTTPDRRCAPSPDLAADLIVNIKIQNTSCKVFNFSHNTARLSVEMNRTDSRLKLGSSRTGNICTLVNTTMTKVKKSGSEEDALKSSCTRLNLSTAQSD